MRVGIGLTALTGTMPKGKMTQHKKKDEGEEEEEEEEGEEEEEEEEGGGGDKGNSENKEAVSDNEND